MDDVFATGNDSNDGSEYSEALAWTSVAYTGADSPTDTVRVDFYPGTITARYVKLSFERLSLDVAIDEVEIFGTPQSVPSPAPAALLLMGIGLLGGARRLRR
jgi:hypothetical protein